MASLENMSEAERNSAALKRMMNHPELGLEAKRLWKKIEPTANFPDLDMRDQLDAVNKTNADKIEALENQMRERDVLARREANHALIRDAGLDVEQVEKVMTDEKILNYGTAIKYLKGQSALAPPTPQAITPIRMPDNMKEIQKNPVGWARTEAHNALNELIAKRR
jgi:hypothetical protein